MEVMRITLQLPGQNSAKSFEFTVPERSFEIDLSDILGTSVDKQVKELIRKVITSWKGVHVNVENSPRWWKIFEYESGSESNKVSIKIEIVVYSDATSG